MLLIKLAFTGFGELDRNDELLRVSTVHRSTLKVAQIASYTYIHIESRGVESTGLEQIPNERQIGIHVEKLN